MLLSSSTLQQCKCMKKERKRFVVENLSTSDVESKYEYEKENESKNKYRQIIYSFFIQLLSYCFFFNNIFHLFCVDCTSRFRFYSSEVGSQLKMKNFVFFFENFLPDCSILCQSYRPYGLVGQATALSLCAINLQLKPSCGCQHL